MNIRNKTLSTLMAAFALLLAGSVARATFSGTQNGWFPITPTNSVSASAALYSLGSAGRPLRVFALRPDNNIWIDGQNSDGSWQTWYSLGGPVKSAPAAASWSVNDQLMVAQANDNAFWYRKFAPGTYSNVGQGWGAWTSLGGAFISAPTVTAKGSGKFFICGLGTDSRIWCGYLNTGGFTGWQRQAMPTAGGKEVLAIYSPAVGTVTSNMLELFMVGSNKHMYHTTYEDAWGGWATWDDLGGQFIGAPAYAAWASNDMVVLGTGTNNTVYRKRFTGSNYLGGPWDNLPGGTILSGSGLTATSRGTGEYEVVAEGTNYGLFLNIYNE